jgi:hypothetical protein
VAIVAATATAEAWTILEAEMVYQGEQISFELIPVEMTQIPASSPRTVRVRLILRQLPENIGDLEPFLTQLRQHLTLSIPKRNLIVTSSGYEVEKHDGTNQNMKVYYLFNADLEDFSHAELVFSGTGNPLFAPVPVMEAAEGESDN